MSSGTNARLTVLVRGVGDIGSAVAHRLFREGHAVVIHDGPEPTTSRRLMAFVDAVFDGQAVLAGVQAVRANGLLGVTRASRAPAGRRRSMTSDSMTSATPARASWS